MGVTDGLETREEENLAPGKGRYHTYRTNVHERIGAKEKADTNAFFSTFSANS